MDKRSYQESSLGDYVGDILSGNARPNQLIPQHPFLLNTLQLEEVLNKNTEHIMLLTMDEAKDLLEDLYNTGTSYAGNIKDSLSGAINILKLMSYNDGEKLVFNLKGFNIKATPYVYKGVAYVKISGYASLRRIINGTRYGAKHIEILKLGIGQAGINYGIMKGASFSICFSGAQRTLEYIFSSEHDVAEFIGNITMDVAKAIVTIFVTKIVVATASGMAALAGFSMVLPVSVGIFFIVALGVTVTIGLHMLDEHFHLTEKIIGSINEGLAKHREIMEWNLQHNEMSNLLMMANGY